MILYKYPITSMSDLVFSSILPLPVTLLTIYYLQNTRRDFSDNRLDEFNLRTSFQSIIQTRIRPPVPATIRKPI